MLYGETRKKWKCLRIKEITIAYSLNFIIKCISCFYLSLKYKSGFVLIFMTYTKNKISLALHVFLCLFFEQENNLLCLEKHIHLGNYEVTSNRNVISLSPWRMKTRNWVSWSYSGKNFTVIVFDNLYLMLHTRTNTKCNIRLKQLVSSLPFDIL